MATNHDDYGMPNTYRDVSKRPWWNPRFWSRRVWIFSGVIVIVIIVVAVVAGVLAGKSSSSSNAYPDYSPLSYQLQDTSMFQSSLLRRLSFLHTNILF